MALVTISDVSNVAASASAPTWWVTSVRATKALAKPTCSGSPGMVRDPSTTACEFPAAPRDALPRDALPRDALPRDEPPRDALPRAPVPGASAGLEPSRLRSAQGRGYPELLAGVSISSPPTIAKIVSPVCRQGAVRHRGTHSRHSPPKSASDPQTGR